MTVVLIVSSVLIAWVLQAIVARDEKARVRRAAMVRDVPRARPGGFGIILRSDQPAELFDGDGPRQEVRCLRDVSAA